MAHAISSEWVEDKNGGPVGWTLDVMRRLPGGFRYTTEFVIASACRTSDNEGCLIVSLSGAPLACCRGDDDLDRGALETFLDRLGATLEPYDGFRSLHAFKAKFQPASHPLYSSFPTRRRCRGSVWRSAAPSSRRRGRVT